MREIPKFPNYCVTISGHVWSRPNCFHKGKWKNEYVDKDGHLHTTLYRNGKRINTFVHHLVLETYIGPRPLGNVCRHKDGNPANNHLINLCWGTPKENTQDSLQHGTARCLNQNGEKNATSRLIENQVRLIFHAYHDGAYTQQELADYFGIARSLVGLICQKKRWGHLWAA